MPDRPSAPDRPEFDVFVQGTVFFDIVLTGLQHPPEPGAETYADGMGSCPGGVANFAIAASRLGLQTGLAAVFGDDVYADFCWRTLADQEGVDLTRSRRVGYWHSPVTVSMAVGRDRAMVTHAHDAPPDPPDPAVGSLHTRAAMVSAGGGCEPSWVEQVRADGGLLFADVGWDPTRQWSPALLERLSGYHAFLPNSVEAMAYTRTGTPRQAVRALAERFPLAVVTCGGDGALAIDSGSGEQVAVPALEVRAIDPTGAGDVFGAALVLGTLRRWPLAQRVAFANLCAGLSVQHVGGSLAAPGWGDIIDWATELRSRGRAGWSVAEDEVLRHYAFIAAVLPEGPVPIVRRATATLARQSDAY